MAQIKPKTGPCHLCGRITKLSFEHVPPEKAFNNKRAFFYTGDQIVKRIGLGTFPWDFSGLKYTQSQRGLGGYTLCERCNSNTGGWYADDFINFIHQGYDYVLNSDQKSTNPSQLKSISFTKIYPQRVVKQVLTMFCSINSPNMTLAHPELRALLLNPENKGWDFQRFSLSMYLAYGEVLRNIGVSGILNVNTGVSRVVSELSTPPFGFVLEFNPSQEVLNLENNILSLVDDNFESKRDITLRMPALETNTQYPVDYRTRSEVLEQYFRSNMLSDSQKTHTAI